MLLNPYLQRNTNEPKKKKKPYNTENQNDPTRLTNTHHETPKL